MQFAQGIRKLSFVLAFSLCAAVLHAQTYSVESGKTSVALDAGFVSALKSLGVTPGTIGPTTISGGMATFPAVAGAFNVNNAKTQILHSGGLTLSGSKARVRLQSYIIDTLSGSPVVTGIVVVNGIIVKRIALFDVHLPSGIKFPLMPANGDMLALSNIELTLNSGAATALNNVFGVNAFMGGMKIGKAKVSLTVYEDRGK